MNEGIVVAAAAAPGVDLPLALSGVEEAVRFVLDAEGVTAAEISLAFIGDDEIAAMNERYLAHAGATDVISFALHESGGRPLGDIYIGATQAVRQAGEMGVPVEHELLRLSMHGTLHVLGWDHPEQDERDTSPMYLRQEALLAEFLTRFRLPSD